MARTPWFPRTAGTSGPLPPNAAQEDTQQQVVGELEQLNTQLQTPSPLPAGGATEATSQAINTNLGVEGGGVAPPLPPGASGVIGWLRSIRDLLFSAFSVVSGVPAVRVDVVQTVGGGGGGGGDASAANQVTEIAKLDAIIAKLIAAPSTEAKQDAAIALLTTINSALGAPLTIGLPADASTETKQDAIITALGTLQTLLSGTLSVGLPSGAATSANQSTIITALGTLGTQTTLAAILAKIIAAPATEATLANVLSALSSVAVTVAVLPLPSGASTSALQSTGNTTLASILSALSSVAVTGPLTDTQLRASAVPVSLATAPALVASSAIIGKVGIDQTTPGTTNGVQVNAALPAGTNAIGKLAANSGVDIGDVDVTSLPALAAGTNEIGKTFTSHQITKALTNTTVSASSSGENTLVSGTSSQTIRVFRVVLVAASAVSVKFKDAAGGNDLTGAMPLTANGTMVLESNNGEPLFVTASSGAFILNLSGAITVTGFVQYTKS